MMLPAVAGEVGVEQPRACDADDYDDYDRSKCFLGDVPTCWPCRDGFDFAGEMLATGYTLSESGEKNYGHSDSTHLVVTGRIAKVDGLPADLLTHGVEALVDFEVEHAFVHPTPEPPSVIRIAMDSDLFAWGDSGISRLALRHSVLPYLFHHRNQIRTMVRELEKQTERPVDWQSVYLPPQVYSDYDYRGDVSPKDSVLAASLPRLGAIETWLESVLPDGLNAHVSPDGTSFNQPSDVNDVFSAIIPSHIPRGGGFHDRAGTLNLGDRLLIAFRKKDLDGQLYRIKYDSTWRIFWGAEMEVVETALHEVTACVAKRLGKSRLLTDGDDREAHDLAYADCSYALGRARRNGGSTR